MPTPDPRTVTSPIDDSDTVEVERCGRYEVVGKLGAGGMGIVLEAHDPMLHRNVALKLLRPRRNWTAIDGATRLVFEAQAMARLAHPNVVTVFEIDWIGDQVYVAMELVAGTTLRGWMRERPRQWREIVEMFVAAGRGLAAAHAAGLVHRDFKPDNVLIGSDGRPRVSDFGLVAEIAEIHDNEDASELIAQERESTYRGSAAGTPAYMSAEQWRGLPVDARGDQFAFCVALWEALCDHRPFSGELPHEIRESVRAGAIAEPPSRWGPCWLFAMLRRGLASDPRGRWPDMTTLLDEITRRARRGSRWMVAAIVASVAIVAVLTASGVTYLASRSARPRNAVTSERQVLAWETGDRAVRLSPDGKLLAVARDGRLLLQDVAIGTTRELPAPPSQPYWIRWFPDGSKLLLGIASGPARLDLVVDPIRGGLPTTLPVHPWGAEVSHDGTRLAMYDPRGVEVSNIDGTHTRLLVERSGAELGWPLWSPDDRWIGYAIRGPDRGLQIRAVSATNVRDDGLLVEDRAIAPSFGLPSYVWASNGRLLYNTYHGSASALVALDIDTTTARVQRRPVELASYLDSTSVVNASRSGRILFNRIAASTVRYVADPSNDRLNPKPTGHQSWQLVGIARDGATSVYRTQAGTDRTELLSVTRDNPAHVFASFEGSAIDPRLTPDETAILYLYVDEKTEALSLRRVSLTGGTPILIEDLPYRPSASVDFTSRFVAQLGCARRPDRRCVLGAAEGNDEVFYEVDPARGRGQRLTALRGPTPWVWALSSDGTRAAVAHREDPVRIVDLASGDVHDLVRDPRGAVYRITWLDNADAVLFATGQVFDTALSLVDAKGQVRVVWSSTTGERVGDLYARHDGTEIEFSTRTWSRSYWLLEPGG